jgi:uncharacterized coiled-coil protein SlyX
MFGRKAKIANPKNPEVVQICTKLNQLEHKVSFQTSHIYSISNPVYTSAVKISQTSSQSMSINSEISESKPQSRPTSQRHARPPIIQKNARFTKTCFPVERSE